MNASATVVADADLAVVHVGYKLFDADAKSAYAQATATSNAIMDALTKSDIPKTAIESSSQSIQHTDPDETTSRDRSRRQFTVSQSWSVRVKPEQAAATLNTAINAGANESGSIEWTFNDPNRLTAEASQKALANAHTIAEQMLIGSGVRLGRLMTASQSQGIPTDRFVGGLVQLNGRIGPSGAPLALTSPRITYTVSVEAVYAIE